ncbi:anthrone oxygenase family protein [Pseudonocardia spirodelae]|uniref:Anthrone oxygenase family protein n=1 Tax=Pseudonocardia spirodelae TaxID=3133431 RepID=A0ABU8T6Q2_9PSEU
MTGPLDGALTGAAVTGAGLLGGIYLAFSVAVVPALRRRPAAEAAAVMRGVNRVIVNPVFGTLFAGTALVAGAVTVAGVLGGAPLRAAGGLAVLAGFAVTAAVNIPLNHALDRDGDWAAFAPRWAAANHVRAGASALGVVALLL